MLEGYTSVPIEQFGGLICAWPPEMLAETLMVEATNVRFTLAEVASREGLTAAFATPNRAAIAGLVDYVHLDGTEQPLVFDASGKLYVEAPAGSGTLALADPGSPLVLPAGCWMNGVATFDRCYLAFGDGKLGVGQPLSFDGANLDPVTIAGPTALSTASDSATAGNIAAGVRYGLVLYQTREGSLTPAGPVFQWTAAGAKQASVSSLPIGPAQVAARVVAFTVAGGTSAGPYFYIGTAQTVNGVNETSTVVTDNVTTSATFNFDDAFLASANDVTDQFRAIVLPEQAGVAFSETTQRMMWWGDPAQPSVVQCSQPSDAGNYFGDTGFYQVAENNGQRVTAVFEFRNQIYASKQESLHLVTPNNGDPATWPIQQISPLTGIAGPRAVAVGDGFVIFVHRTGCYQFDGSVPTLISAELLGPSPDRPGLWERINWAQEHLIWVAIDHESKCVRIGVPLDQATTCSHILKVSYLDGWDASLRFSPFSGRYHYFPGRRWSLDEVAATQAVRVKRPLAQGAFASDRRIAVSQVLLGSADASGEVSFVDASATADNGRPFSWVLRTGAMSAAEVVKQQRQGMELMGLVQVRARGSGAVVVETVAGEAAPRAFLSAALNDRVTSDLNGLAMAQGSAIGLRFSNQGNAATLRLAAVHAFVRPSWSLTPGV